MKAATGGAMRINIESFFAYFDSQLLAALESAVQETASSGNRRDAAKLYQAFKRQAIVTLPPWESFQADAMEQTYTGLPQVKS